MSLSRFRFLVLGSGLVALASVSVIADASEPVSRRLTLLHTSDIHGQVLPVDDTRGDAYPGSLAQVATLVEAIRAEVEGEVLVLDSGDAIQGTPFEQLAHLRWGEPSPMVAAMNRIGHAAMAIGNHEFNFGLEVLRRAEAQADFPFLSANVLDEKTGEPAFPPYVVRDLDGLRVGLLGLTTPNIPGWELPENYRGLVFADPDEAARRWLPVLKDEQGCDLVVVIAHTGFERDPVTGEPSGTGHEDFGWRIAQVPGVDVLLTGHSHRDIAPVALDGVIVSQPSSRARRLSRIDLELEPAGEGWRIASWRGENLRTAQVEPHPWFAERFAVLHRRVVESLDEPLTTVATGLSVAGCRLHDCAALDLIHQVQLEASAADLSLAAILSNRTPDLEPGPLTWRWVHALYVYPNTLHRLEVTGAQVKDLLEHTARFYDGLECSAGAGCTVVTDPSIPHYNVDSMAGVTYRIDPTRPEGDRVRDLRHDGRPLDPEAVFSLVVNSYRASGGGMFPHLADAPVQWRTSVEMTDLLGDWLARQQPWRPTVDGNWSLAPDLSEREAAASSY